MKGGEENERKNESIEEFSISFFKDDDNHSKIRAFYTFLHSYSEQFDCFPETIIQTDIFLNLIKEVSNICCHFLAVSAKSDNQSNKAKTTPDTFENNLESANLCFEILQLCFKCSSETIEKVTIIEVALKILHQGYTHCKESEVIYGSQLSQFVNQLGSIFKNIEKLQMVVLQNLDQLSKNFEKNTNFKSIVLELGNLCRVVSGLDADVDFDLWTIYLRIISENEKYLDETCGEKTALLFLVSKCVEILEICKLNLNKNLEEDEELCLKLNFYLNSSVKILNIFQKNEKEIKTNLQLLLLNYFDFLILCYSPFAIEKNVLNAVKQILIKTSYSLLSYMYIDEEFLVYFLLSDLIECKFKITTNLLKVCGLQFLKSPTLQAQVLDKLLTCLMLTTPEEDLYLVNSSIPMCTINNTNSEELISLYQLLYEKMCDTLCLLDNSIIKDMQNTVLKCIMSSSDVVFLLICDIWMYRLRFGNVQLLKEQCCLILQNYLIDNNRSVRIELMLQRMLKFLPQNEQEMLREKFPFIKSINNEDKVIHTHAVADFCVNNLFSNLEEKTKTLLSKLKEPINKSFCSLVERACKYLELCSLYVNYLDCTQTLQCLELTLQLSRTEIYEIQIAALTFIKALSKIFLPEQNPEFLKIISKFAELFYQMVHSKNYVVKDEALNTFVYFSKCTKHVKIVQETIRHYPDLKASVKSYITAVPNNGFLSEKEKAETLRSQMSFFNKDTVEIPEERKALLQNIISKITPENI